MCPLDCEKDMKLEFPFQSTLFTYEFGETLCEQSGGYRTSLEFISHLAKKSFQIGQSYIFIEISKKVKSIWKLEG